MVGHSFTGGVKPMSIAGRYVNERERLAGMTDAERAFRKQWLQDQILSPNEPRPVPQLYKEFYNPIRRFYRWPLDKVEAKLTPVLGAEFAGVFRFVTAKVGFVILGAYWFAYYAKYNANNWTRKRGISKKDSRTATDLGDPEFPKVSDRMKPSDYADKGFKDCKINF